MTVLHPNRILIRYGEIALKGKNRGRFEGALRRNLRLRLTHAGLQWPVAFTHDGLYIDVIDQPEALPKVYAMLEEVPGIVSFSPAWWTAYETGEFEPAEIDRAEAMTVTLASGHYAAEAAFCVRVKRSHRSLAISSLELERRYGQAIIDRTPWQKVRLDDPDRTFHIHFYRGGFFVSTGKMPGMGGLPVGSAGRVLTLLSGGIDSAVAAYMMAKRGCRTDFIHVTATRAQQNDADAGVVGELARQLSRYTLRSRLYLISSDRFEIALLAKEPGYEVVLFRRYLARLAERLSQKTGALALITGDSLGQVASQTLENIVTTTAATSLPILRPLIGFDKQEIIALAQKIGTFEISIQPYKDCCALIDRNPVTNSTVATAKRKEAQLPDYEALIDASLADMRCIEFECGERVTETVTGDSEASVPADAG